MLAAMGPPRPTPFNPNKHLKEEFISNIAGSSMLEIAFLSAFSLTLLWRCISSSSNTRDLLSALEVKPKKSDNVTVGLKFWMNRIINQVVEFLCVIVPIISIFTVLSEWTCACAICLALVLIIWIVTKRWILALGWILCGGKCICFKTSKDYYIIEMGRLHFNLFMWGNMVSIGIFCTLAAVSILSTMINICPQHCGVLGDSVIIGNETRGNWWAMISVWFLSLLFCLVLFL